MRFTSKIFWRFLTFVILLQTLGANKNVILKAEALYEPVTIKYAQNEVYIDWMEYFNKIATMSASGKLQGADSNGPFRIRIEQHTSTVGYSGNNPYHTAIHAHLDRRDNVTTGAWHSVATTQWWWF
jgi:hypothetical protein